MIEYIKKGNILDCDAEVLINTVNTVGVMGAGIALQFKKAFPENFKLYEKEVQNGELQIGKLFIYETGNLTNPKYIVNFPTKKDWKHPSKLAWVKEGLVELRKFILEKNIKSIAIPPLGCGNGKLDWNDVKPLILNYVEDIEGLTSYIFEPSEFAYQKVSVKSKTKKPQLTSVRAMVIGLLNRYTILGYELTLLEAQKLVYFLQRFGEPLKLDFEKGKFGPYSNKLVHVLYDLDGHYLFGMKSKTAKPFDKITLNRSEINNVLEFVEANCTNEQKQRLNSVYKLIEGFESPLGMELLATVDYVAFYELDKSFNIGELISKIHNWTPRKKNLLNTRFITVASGRLDEFTRQLYA